MKTAALTILALLLGGSAASAQSAPSRIAILTFNQTEAAMGDGCQGMIHLLDVANRAPRVESLLAPSAWSCLRDVEEETSDPVAAEVPRTVLVVSCHRLRRDDPRDYRKLKGYCAGV